MKPRGVSAGSHLWPAVRLALACVAAVAAAGVLAGCSGVPAASPSVDASRVQPEASGVTVYGDIDVGVTRQRTR